MTTSMHATTHAALHKAAKIQNRAMLVNVGFSSYQARKFDRDVTAQAESANGATNAGRFNKLLLNGESYKALHKLIGEIRTFNYANTLPWTDKGYRLLPTANWKRHTDKMRSFRPQFDALVDAFVHDYQNLIDEARTRLAGMFDAADYPDETEIRDRYALNVDYMPIPDGGDVRVDMPPETIAELDSYIQDRITTATGNAMNEVYSRLFDAVKHLHKKLDDPKAIFRDSLVGNVRELVEILPTMNVVDDPDLARIIDSVATDVAAIEPQALRDDKAQRAETADKADKILGTMQNAFGNGGSI